MENDQGIEDDMGRFGNKEDIVLPVGGGDCNGTDGDHNVSSNGKNDSGVSFGIVGEDGSRSRGIIGQANENVKTFVEEVSQ